MNNKVEGMLKNLNITHDQYLKVSDEFNRIEAMLKLKQDDWFSECAESERLLRENAELKVVLFDRDLQKNSLIDLVRYYEANPVDKRNRLFELMESWKPLKSTSRTIGGENDNN